MEPALDVAGTASHAAPTPGAQAAGRGRDDRDDVSPAQARAVAALLQGSTLADAAKDAGVTAQTVGRWRKRDPAFRRALAAAWVEFRVLMLHRVVGLADRAISTLADVMDNGLDSRARVAACTLAFDLVDRKLGTRIDDLRDYRDTEAKANLDRLDSDLIAPGWYQRQA